MKQLITVMLLTASLLLSSTAAWAVTEADSISFPAISSDGETVYFTSWGDIWTAPRDGSAPARRLSVNVAFEGRPMLSPDGSKIAFLSDRYGNFDLFVMDAAGGEATRLTWDSSVDYPYDWKPDGSALLAYSMRGDDVWALSNYEVPLDGSQPKRISGPDHDDHTFASYLGSADQVVYSRGPGNWARRNHHGSDCYDLWSYDTATGEHTQLTDWEGTDLWPQPSPDGSVVYFVSDRSGSENIWALTIDTGELSQLTQFSIEAPRWPRISEDGDELVFELAGELWSVSTSGGDAAKIPVYFSDDQKHLLANQADVPGMIGEVAVSPNHNYYAVTVLGDIYVLKNPDSYDEEPDQDTSRTHQLTATAGREMQLSWHPEDLLLAYVSDRHGQFDVYTLDLTTLEETRLTSTPDDEWFPSFAPKGGKLAWYEGGRKLMVHELESGETSLAREGQLRHGPWSLGYDWAPDGNWLAVAEAQLGYRADVILLDLVNDADYNVSFDPHWSSGPQFSADGKYLTYSQARRNDESDVLLVELNPEEATYDTELLFAADVPEEEPEAEETAEEESDAVDDSEATEPADEAEEDDQLVIDTERIHLRGYSLTGMQGSAWSPYFDPNSGYLIFVSEHEGAREWWSVDLEGSELSMLGPVGEADPVFAPDGGRIYFAEGGQLSYIEMGGQNAVGGGMVRLTSRVDYDQYAIWEQMLEEGWRHLRESFYDEDMMGMDWDGALERYLPRVRSLGTTQEYNRLYRELLGELGGSHLGFYGGGSDVEEAPDATGDFGVSYDPSHSGAGWLIASVLTDGPADQPGSELEPGDLITAVNGQAVDTTDNRARVLRNLAGQPVTLTVTRADEELEITVFAAAAGWLRQLKYDDWVRANRESVYQASMGSIAYQHIQGNNQRCLVQFERELFTESLGKDALILDMRFNGGGNIAEEIVEILDRRAFANEIHRDGEPHVQPSLIWDKPIVVLINAHSFSDAEITPWILKDLGLATIIGEQTGGNVIGTYDFSLMDGSQLRLPSWGWYRLNGMDMEGNGCPPDIAVHIDPAQVATGEDNQLAAAVEYLLGL